MMKFGIDTCRMVFFKSKLEIIREFQEDLLMGRRVTKVHSGTRYWMSSTTEYSFIYFLDLYSSGLEQVGPDQESNHLDRSLFKKSMHLSLSNDDVFGRDI